MRRNEHLRLLIQTRTRAATATAMMIAGAATIGGTIGTTADTILAVFRLGIAPRLESAAFGFATVRPGNQPPPMSCREARRYVNRHGGRLIRN